MPLLNRLVSAPAQRPPLKLHADTSLDEYDLNFALGEVPSSLEASGVRLVPVIPSLNGRAAYEAFLPPSLPEESAESVWRYMPYGPFATYDEFLAFLEGRRLDPGTLLFVVFNTVSDIEDDPVGIAALLNSDKANLVTELGHFRFLPKVQTCWLLAELAFETYGVRRLQWFANALNEPSKTTALRLGFRHEGDLRWHRVLPESKRPHGVTVPVDATLGSPNAGPGRHSALLAIGWDDWEGGVREKVRALADRPPVRHGKGS